jgi:hypothetical protein
VGYNDENQIRSVITKLFINTKKNGILIKNPIAKPSNPETTKLIEIVGMPNEINKEYVYNSMVKLVSSGNLDFSKFGYHGKLETLSATVCDVLDDAKLHGSVSSMLKSSFINFMCWFIRYNMYEVTNILYMGTPSKNEVYWLYILNSMGCQVNTISFVDDTNEYLKVDNKNKYSNLILGTKFTPLNIDFKSINVDDYIFEDRLHEINQQRSKINVTHLEMATQNDVLGELSIVRSQRVGTSDGVTEPCYFTLLSGFDDEDCYRNMLFNIRKDITNSTKPLIFIEQELEKPSYDEGAEYYSISRNNVTSMLMAFVDRLEVPTSNDRTILAKQKFLSIMNTRKSSISANALFGICVNVSVWFKQCVGLVDFLKSDIPVFFFYGNPNSQEYILMQLLWSVGFDILIACPDKTHQSEIVALDIDNTMQTFEYANSGKIKEFPAQLVRAKVATTAYNASKDLDHILYNDGYMFRDRHYAFCQTVTLKTTIDEIDILWHVESKFRPGFASDEKTITVPNIFAKLDGIPFGETNKYLKEIQGKLTPNTVYYKLTPFFKPAYGMNDFTGFFNGNRLDLARIKLNPNINKYTHLPDNIQDFIFQKMQEVIDSGYLKLPKPDIMHLVIKVGTMLPNNILQLIQNYDFTKEIPKVVIIHSTKTAFSAYECILLLLLNFMGFDILVYTPTGYKNVESFLDSRAFEQYNIGEFQYNLIPPTMRIPKAKPSKKFGFFRKK